MFDSVFGGHFPGDSSSMAVSDCICVAVGFGLHLNVYVKVRFMYFTMAV